jgi:NitT/TauT family transport system ATP-binding protein
MAETARRSSLGEPARGTPDGAKPVVSGRAVSLVYPGDGRSAPVVALKDITFDILSGSFVSLLGPSGCGKSTLLRIIADLLPVGSGTVTVNGRSPGEARLARQIGFVFQDPALLEWRRVLGNVALPLELHGVPRAEREDRAVKLLELVGLKGFEKSWPRELSGGMRQRAAIARSLSTEPPVLLMDEPFGALDEISRDRLNIELIRIHEATGVTVVFVTHSIREAVLLSDQVVVMTPRPGQITRVIDVPFARPRSLSIREDFEFQSLVNEGSAELERGYTDAAS